ncbi:hypothetical protein FUAX_38520 (plasmid) [Fulvitalea axinellae]|uniref:STAS/SEC14 domain-containing protein n=1 Tax=Fulvitalea axinellae TaxID=1182444 RepID=A0AAU9CPV4_9BACT|nr:hypothetical protein FUAX_38520 [Fulvitalea axinellae]
MIHFEKTGTDNVYAFTIDGKIDKESLRVFYEVLEKKKQEGQRIKLLGEVKDMAGFDDLETFGLLMKTKLKALDMIERYAIVSDLPWIDTAVPIGDFLAQGMSIKKFASTERGEALEWLREKPAETLSSIDLTHLMGTRIYTCRLYGTLTKDKITELQKLLKDTAKGEKISLLCVIEHFKGVDSLTSLIKGFQTDLMSVGRIDKCALLTDAQWLAKFAPVYGHLLPGLAVRAFHLDEEEVAKGWLME